MAPAEVKRPDGRGHQADPEARIWAALRARVETRSPISVMVVSPRHEDHERLRQILAGPEFRVFTSVTAREAVAGLRKRRPEVILADCRAGDCYWKDMLCAVRSSGWKPLPRLIVLADRADGRLWEEVMSLGAETVLARPLEAAEVAWAVSDAWRAWSRENELLGEPAVVKACPS